MPLAPRRFVLFLVVLLLPTAVLLLSLEVCHWTGVLVGVHRFEGEGLVLGILLSIPALVLWLFALVTRLFRLRYVIALMNTAVVLSALSLGIPLGFANTMGFINVLYSRYSKDLVSSTKWAPNFDDDAFGDISPGAERAWVIRRLGTPLRTFEVEKGREILTYSDPGPTYSTASAYHQRWILLDGGRVVKVLSRLVTPEHSPLRHVPGFGASRIRPLR